MKHIYTGLLCLALLPAAGTPVLARSTGGALMDALGSAARHAGGDEGGTQIAVTDGMVSAADPQTVVDALQAKGYRAELTTDSYGDPQVKTAAEGADYTVDFYGCSDGANCDSLLFTVGFDTDDGLAMDTINSWNSTRAIAGAYLDDEMDPFLDMYVLTEGGIPATVFDAAVDEWTSTLAEFMDYIDW